MCITAACICYYGSMIELMLAVAGLCLGSFVNALVWRLHSGKDWVKGRSECTHCHRRLRPGDLVPVISWLCLRGKCRYCRKPIQDSPLVELTLPVLFIASYLFWPFGFQDGWGIAAFAVWLMLLTVFLALAVYDLRWFLLPDVLVVAAFILALGFVAARAIAAGDWSIFLGALAGSVTVAGIFGGLYVVSKKTWIGGGDVKLGVVLGLLAGNILSGLLVLFAASCLGLLASLPLIAQGKAKRDTKIPFGPFLIAGTVVTVLFGSRILGWYSNLFIG